MDASDCYDCIIPPLSIAPMQWAWLPKTGTETTCWLMENVKYQVKMVYGILTDYYIGTPSLCKHGKGQGKTSSPGTWLLLSCILIDTLQKYSSGGLDPFAWLSSRPFIDNNDHMVTYRHAGLWDELTCIVGDMEKKNPVWERLLYETWGSLAVETCFW